MITKEQFEKIQAREARLMQARLFRTVAKAIELEVDHEDQPARAADPAAPYRSGKQRSPKPKSGNLPKPPRRKTTPGGAEVIQ